ncbi:SpoIIAA family protein [Yoonia sp. 208BN28-4]|uniref:STAS/SEC14 domain-containing protein n=1 Tax=Yoonia sp. 208BN28-4 TaxID=3126505 RepID=UPI0030AAF9A1
MFNVTKVSDNRMDIEISGAIDANTMQRAMDDLINGSADMKHGTMLYTISDFSLPTLSAIGVEMTYLPQLFGLLGKFDYCAVLSDSGWLRTAAGAKGALFPGLEIKAFEMSQRAAAEDWLTSKTVAEA